MKKVSLKDIAQKTGVSTTTVSIVLNGNGENRKISGEMIDKILREANKLNYRPNLFAKSLRTGKTFTIGLIVDDISNFFFGHLAKTVEEEFDRFGYTVMFCNSENNEGKARNVLDILLDKQMDGYIIAPTQGMLPEIQCLVEEKKPIVLIDRFFQQVPACYVTLDNYKGAFESIDHLVRQGYKNIAIVTSETEQIQMQERLEGFKAALQKNGLPFLPERVKKIPFRFSEQRIVQEIEKFVKENPDLDAVLFTSNNLGISGLESLRNLNIKVAVDIGVICFDDNDLFRLSSPGITVVSQPIKQIGKNAVKTLLDLMDNRKIENRNIVLPPNLVVRGSTPAKDNSRYA
jgi:LacI family transcriptional regulator